MRLTKFGHSCVRLDDGDRTLTIDPGVFSDADAALDGTDAILLTHQHFDHVDADKIKAVLHADSRLRVYAPQDALDSLDGIGEQGVAVRGGESLQVAGFDVRTFGDQHAVIHPLVPYVSNVGYFVGGVYHPGDSLIVPPFDVTHLLLPAMAPWAKLSELVDYAVAVRAPQLHPIHDFLVKDVYFGILRNTLDLVADPFGIAYTPFDEPVDV